MKTQTHRVKRLYDDKSVIGIMQPESGNTIDCQQPTGAERGWPC